ncbi:plastocyanin/azurin family copper-binding protein [Natrinema sp. 1APR25-10V2]|uniref:plastocyanin/azurin family copper-binding protein n=1 Tax=Natrinema sp. 1APR25-10V2 TaxID=2951081 RepID=UPI002876B436|nr:plastocyanin/azurin family copper-binding protein [Natrinema sp. 1APR25-10V2]MDS0476279.1 plastocyanin/azurin family copper-binding protein [Natrinema sp. 1APR25-10V2]
MARDKAVSRRTALKLTGAAASTALVAGCSSGGNGNGNGNGNGDDSGGVEIEAGTDIRFSGQTSHWEGLKPSSIEGEKNPTLVLTEGETYTIGWTEGDGAAHNIELRNDSGDVVNELTSGDPVSEPGDGQILEFTASSDITTYRCEPHPSMEGSIELK